MPQYLTTVRASATRSTARSSDRPAPRYKAPSLLNHPVQAGRTIYRKPRIPTTWQGRQLFIFCLPILSSGPSNSS